MKYIIAIIAMTMVSCSATCSVSWKKTRPAPKRPAGEGLVFNLPDDPAKLKIVDNNNNVICTYDKWNEEKQLCINGSD